MSDPVCSACWVKHGPEATCHDAMSAEIATLRAEVERLEDLNRKQWGCGGTDRHGKHHHDDRCIPGLTAERDALAEALRELVSRAWISRRSL